MGFDGFSLSGGVHNGGTQDTDLNKGIVIDCLQKIFGEEMGGSVRLQAPHHRNDVVLSQ